MVLFSWRIFRRLLRVRLGLPKVSKGKTMWTVEAGSRRPDAFPIVDQQRQSNERMNNKLCGRPPQYAPAPCKLTFEILTLKVVFESRVTWATSVPILVFLGLSVLDLGTMYATDRCQTNVRRASLLNATWGGA